MTAVHDSPLKILRFASDELAAFIKKTRSHGTIAMHVGLAKRLRLAKNLPFSCSRVGRRPVGSRGRDASYLAPPAQIRTCSFPAYGSYLGYVTAKRLSGHG